MEYLNVSLMSVTWSGEGQVLQANENRLFIFTWSVSPDYLDGYRAGVISWDTVLEANTHV
jgi:hypothetical protein